MEVQLNEEQAVQFTIDAGWLEDDDRRCPFCKRDLIQDDAQYDQLSCENPDCSYATQETVRDVFAALVEAGRDPLQAALIAAAYTAESDDEIEPVTKQRFTINDMSSADWVLKKLASLEAQLSNINEMVDNEIQSIELRREKLIYSINKQIKFFKMAFSEPLEEWTKAELKDKKVKSVNLLHGKVGFKKDADKTIIDDEDKAIKLLEADCPDAVRTKKEVKKTELKNYLADKKIEKLVFTTDDSESVIVVHIEKGEDKFYVQAELPGERRLPD